MEIVTLAERPDLIDAHWGLTAAWPSFMLNDPIADLFYSQLDVWSEHALLVLDDNEIVARGFTVGFTMGIEVGREELPDDG